MSCNILYDEMKGSHGSQMKSRPTNVVQPCVACSPDIKTEAQIQLTTWINGESHAQQ